MGPPATIMPGANTRKRQPEHITYVLSAHGVGVRELITLPQDFFVHTYVPPGKQLTCSLAEPNKICLDPRKAPGNYLPGTPYPNDILSADKKKAFYSGVKDCKTNAIVMNIDMLRRTTNMKEVVNTVHRYHTLNHPGSVAHLHCLYCRDSAEGGRRRTYRRRKIGRTRRRNVKH